MPFSASAAGAIGAGLGLRTMSVDPDKILQLKAELEPIRDEVETFLNTKGRTMAMRPLGADPVSNETAEAFNENAQAAIDAAWGFRDELTNVVDTLGEAARTYRLVDDTHAQNFRQGDQ